MGTRVHFPVVEWSQTGVSRPSRPCRAHAVPSDLDCAFLEPFLFTLRAVRTVSETFGDKPLALDSRYPYLELGGEISVKNSPLLALLMTLGWGTSAYPQADRVASNDESWRAAIEDTVALSRRGEYHDAVLRYKRLLVTEPIASDIELCAYVLSQIADSEIELGEYAEAEARAREGLRTLVAGERTHTGTFAITEGVLADALRAQGNYEEARRFAIHAIGTAKETMNARQPRFAILLTSLGNVLQDTGDLRRAAELCRQAVDIYEHATHASAIDLGTAYQNLAVVYARQGKLKPALKLVDQALVTWNQALPPDHPFILYALNTEILVYQKLKDFRKAEETIPKALELAASRFGPDHPERLILLNNAAVVYVAEKNYQQAETLLKEGAELGRQRFSPGHPLLTSILRNYSYVLRKRNRPEDASRVRIESETLLAFPRK
jgi:tetratricopeptide (TPR) repeat protein